MWRKVWKWQWLALVLAAICLVLPSVSRAMVEYPEPVGDIYVQDYVGVLEPGDRTAMVRAGKALAQRTKAQVVVAVVPPIEIDIDTYATNLFRKWRLGDKELNNGVLLLVVPEQRQVRIEVGYGLEGAINDAKAGQILDTCFVPNAKENRMAAAIRDTYGALLGVTLQEYHLTPADISAAEVVKELPPLGWWEDEDLLYMAIIVFFLIVIVTLAIVYGKGGGGGGSSRYDGNDHYRGGSSGGGGGYSRGGGGSSGGGGASRSW